MNQPSVNIVRRFKLLMMTPDQVVTFAGKWRQQEYVELPTFKDLPPDAKVHSLWYDFPMDTFIIKIMHPSFEQVPLGQEPKIIEKEMIVLKLSQDRMRIL